MRDPEKLDAALRHMAELFALPHSKTPVSRSYTLAVGDAMASLGKTESVGENDGEPVLVPA